MLLKFTTPDMLNTLLIDATTGRCAYEIVTATVPPSELVEPDTPLDSSSASGSSSSFASGSSKQKPSPTAARLVQRRTTIKDFSGTILVDIKWNGRRPDISIGKEHIGGLPELFGSSTIRFMPKILAVPTRFDTEFIWTSTADSLTLFDYDSETTTGTFHHNCIRIPTRAKLSKMKTSSSSKVNLSSPSCPKLSLRSSRAKLSSPSKLTLASPPSSPIDEPCDPPSITSSSSSSPQTSSRSTFISTHLPGVGSNYLEFTPHPLAPDVEIILSFLMMEILRRGRFCLTPYTFDRPRMWQLKEARDLFMRRLRRNTV
ncbi:uncharacterized protein LACBIDRAFT_292206 [Laccaria bicolor S238N-H82]|uniref:Predicted protein n=1 Tax=Laccaria bicolor (strain S238N-H82 / ATCC MYA-4686) TaxID=486041 RepID=B0CS42_LACBS|nr:uncharacterized protein LACBIDRAFT_292206 [Laccaria bicolor S238N-H82]EDR14786.1 predicted protein [Laccaria bicolor S238N-H82]|eukprot:XP_001875345.1 predicted protein [Laccaria bicolor S238N-H82]